MRMAVTPPVGALKWRQVCKRIKDNFISQLFETGKGHDFGVVINLLENEVNADIML